MSKNCYDRLSRFMFGTLLCIFSVLLVAHYLIANHQEKVLLKDMGKTDELQQLKNEFAKFKKETKFHYESSSIDLKANFDSQITEMKEKMEIEFKKGNEQMKEILEELEKKETKSDSKSFLKKFVTKEMLKSTITDLNKKTKESIKKVKKDLLKKEEVKKEELKKEEKKEEKKEKGEENEL